MTSKINYDSIKFVPVEGENFHQCIERRIMQRNNYSYQVRMTEIDKDKKEDFYWTRLETKASIRAEETLQQDWQIYLDNFSQLSPRSCKAHYRLSGTFNYQRYENMKVILPISFVLTFNCDHQTILEDRVLENHISINHVFVQQALLPSLTDEEQVLKKLAYKPYRIDTSNGKIFTTETLLDILIEAKTIAIYNDSLEDKFENDLLFDFARKSIYWASHAETTKHLNYLIFEALASEIFYQFYDGVDNDNGKGYVNKYRVFNHGIPTDHWLVGTINDPPIVKILQNIKNGNAIDIYGRHGRIIPMVVPEPSYISIRREHLHDDFFFQHFPFAHTNLIAPPDASPREIQLIIDKFSKKLIKYNDKPIAPTVEAIRKQGYWEDQDDYFILDSIERIKKLYLQYPKEI